MSNLDQSSRLSSTWDRHGEAFTTAVCAVFVLAGWLAARQGASGYVTSLLFLVAYGVGGYRQAIEGVTKLIRERELEVDLLMVVAAIGAAAIGAWADGALLILIFALSGTLEGYASARTKRDLEALMALHPDEALVMRDDREVLIAASMLAVGDLVIVKPGERIPTDGRIVEGLTTVDQASITGESMPVDKHVGDEVFAGTINGHGALRVVASRPAAETVLARIVQLVQEAQQRRPPAQLFIERFERRYAKVVVAGALLLAIFPPLVLGWTFHAALYRSMIFLVVASPCALAAAMMPTLLSALSNGARNGVLFKGSSFVEAMGRLDAVAFDKTGTLTTGAPRVTDVISLEGAGADHVLAMAAAVESLSNHPLGRAIVAEAKRRGLEVPEAINHEAVGGVGAHAAVGGLRCAIGKPGMFASVPTDVLQQRRRLEAEGKTVVLVGDQAVWGLLALRDTVRPEARAAVAALRKLGIRHVVMLTGDGEASARAIAEETGIDELHADLLPQDKTRVVEELVRRYGRVAMVGDGVNDAPALAAATVGIAMGAAGTDVALETADVVLTTDDLGKIPYAVSLGRRALGVVKQNLVVALGVIVTLVVADLLGRINLPTGVLGHEGSTLLVTLNGLRLLARIPAIRVEPEGSRGFMVSRAPLVSSSEL
ncbi:MAG: heavy metal translocating P-type ATPase [Byssovorax sp.]